MLYYLLPALALTVLGDARRGSALASALCDGPPVYRHVDAYQVVLVTPGVVVVEARCTAPAPSLEGCEAITRERYLDLAVAADIAVAADLAELGRA